VRAFLKYIVLTLGLTLSPQLFAGEVFQLNLNHEDSLSKKQEEKHTWYISGREFRLKIEGGGKVVDYIFTGRSLLACLKIIDANVVKGISIHKDLKKVMNSGLCIVAPINVMTSFLLSPLHSLSFVESDESMKSTVQIKKYTVSKAKATVHENIGCQRIKREFEYGYSSNASTKISGSSDACYTNTSWRKGLWREVSRRLLQQSQAKSLRTQLKTERIEKLGIPITGEIVIRQSTGSGKDIQSSLSTVKVTLKKHQKLTISQRYFKKPSSYQMISTFQSSDRVVAKLNISQKGSKDEVDFGQILRIFIKPMVPGL
jgi:hypothetical protein